MRGILAMWSEILLCTVHKEEFAIWGREVILTTSYEKTGPSFSRADAHAEGDPTQDFLGSFIHGRFWH